jgi:hypothetical protein
MKDYHIYILDICTYLSIQQITSEILLVCKDWLSLLNEENSILYYLKVKYNLPTSIPKEQFLKIHQNTRKNQILNFAAWKTDGGCSNQEFFNSYKNLWEYTPTPYSSYYSLEFPFALKKNLNCLAYFKGGYKSSDNFFESFNNDLYTILFSGQLPEKYAIIHFNKVKCLTIDPLNIETFDHFHNYYHDPVIFPAEFDAIKTIVEYPKVPCLNKAIVTKIALARPFAYTGPAKFLMIIGCEKDEHFIFSDFKKFDDVCSIDEARFLGNVRAVTDNQDFQLVEYERQQGVYPVIWVHFKHCGFNHIEYQLTQAHLLRTFNLKMIDIDDRRVDWGLDSFQANFDMEYCVFIGMEVAD